MLDTFPKDFFFGTAISSYQSEGDNVYADWWQWERTGIIKDGSRSGKACDFWNKYGKYISLNKDLGANAFKLSLEWARLNPKENEWDEKALEHYLSIVRRIKELKMEPLVGVWHFSLPSWLAQKNGWLNPKALQYWQAYLEKVKAALGQEITYWLTLNEPAIYTFKGYLEGTWPPGRKNPFTALRVYHQLIKAHHLAYAILKEKNNQVSASLNLAWIEPKHPWSPLENLVVKTLENYSDWGFLQKIKKELDFLSLNYYFHTVIDLNPFRFLTKKVSLKTSDLGWEIYPHGLYEVVKKAYQLCPLPIIIMENGLADSQDRYRKEFIQDHLQWLFKAYQEGVPIQGYFHWSLLDNFEWQEGKTPRFGLLEMDYDKLIATPRSSYEFYKQIIKSYKERV